MFLLIQIVKYVLLINSNIFKIIYNLENNYFIFLILESFKYFFKNSNIFYNHKNNYFRLLLIQIFLQGYSLIQIFFKIYLL